ncbi:tetratricopeptide repeat protein [Roseiflexus sp.]|uniref:tetratricopeptide repeat protein n=1 Tax=Roseiflexus sp. TaxID=2562120 RepID=UPI00398B2064
MHDGEQYTGAWATPDLIGRKAILQEIEEAIRSASGSSIIALYGPGGIGKTRILSDVMKRQQSPHIYPAKNLIDLYDIRRHSSLDLATAIYESLDVANGQIFSAFAQARDQQRKVQASGDIEQIVATTRNALQAFADNLGRFSQNRRVVIALDTVERVAYGATEQRPPFQVAQSWEWLVESLPTWGNVTLLIAGRTQIRHLFPALQSQPSVRLTPIEVTPLSEPETYDYLEAVAQAAEQAGEQAVADTLRSLTPQRRQQVYRYSEGLPILLALLADYISIAGFGNLPAMFETEPDLKQARAQLEEQLIARLMEAGDIKDTLQILGRAPKGVGATLLSKLLDISHSEAQSRLERIKRLSFIKVRNRQFFLHDEMYAILNRQIYSAPDDAPEAERVNTAIIQWYTQQIDKRRESLDDLYRPIERPRRTASVQPDIDYKRIAAVQQEIQQLLIEQLSYYLRRNPLEGFREYFRLIFYTVFTGNTMLDTQLQAEALAFLDERDPSGSQPHIDGLEREVAQGVTAIRPVARLYAENDYDGVVREAQRLRREHPQYLATAGRTTEAALDIWEALARTGRAKEAYHDSEETDRLLDAAEQILNPIVHSTALDASAARQWRAESLLALLYHTRGFSLRARGQTRSAINAYRRAAALWRQVDVPICLAWTLNNLGFAEVEEGDFTAGLTLITEALEIRRQVGARALAGVSYATLSLALVYTGEYEQAKDNAERALRLCRAVEYRLGEGLALRNLAEVLRRSVRRSDPPEKRMAVLRDALNYATQAYRLFEGIGDRLRQIESLIEKGCALRDMAGVRFDHPEDSTEYQELAKESVSALRKAAALAQETGNTFRHVDALVNIAYVGLSVEDWEYIREGLTGAKEAIPKDYLITPSERPDPERQDILNRRLFTQLARIYMLIGDYLFAAVQKESRLQAISQQYGHLASLFEAGSTTAVTSVEDALKQAFRYYTLAFEYDRLYNMKDARVQRAQNKVYHQVKDLNVERLNIIKSAVSSVEDDYHLGKSAMRNLLESRALFYEEEG